MGYEKCKFFLAFIGGIVLLANFAMLIPLLIFSSSARTSLTSSEPPESRPVLDCEVLIIGSGFAGSYAAYQLASKYNSTLCLIEKLERDGGRIYDVSMEKGGPVFGLGALRITREQKTMHKLAETELDIKLQSENDVEVIKVRGKYYVRDVAGHNLETTNMCLEMFPNAECEDDAIGLPSDKLFMERLLNATQEQIDAHPDLVNLAHALLKDEGFALLRESVRYNSVFSSLSSHGMLEFFKIDGRGDGFDPRRSYPEGGMSQFIIKMLNFAKSKGMRIYHGEGVQEISTRPDGGFRVLTKTFVVRAKKILCSIDPMSFKWVSGDVAEAVKAAPEFKNILPKALVIVAAWWHERWWEKSIHHQTRNLSRVVSHENCFNTMDIPTFAYGRDQNVTRAVYDDGACVDTWRELISDESKIKLLENEVVNSLQSFFTDLEVPRPKFLKGHIHESAWHFQHPRSKMSNGDILNWSLHPTPFDNFALIGEAYNINFAAWCDGALKSVMHVLTKYYDFKYECKDGEDFEDGIPDCPGKSEKKSWKNFDINYALP